MSIFIPANKFITSVNYNFGGLVKTAIKLMSNIKYLTKGIRRDYPPFFRNFKKENGDIRIIRIQACRSPIEKSYNTIINLISLGKFNKLKNKLNYDDMQHTYLLLTLETGAIIRLEKNQVLNVGFFNPIKKYDCVEVFLNGKYLTLNILLDNAYNKIGDKFFLYNAKNNNCQIFVTNILKYSGLLNKQIDKFINQNTNEIIGNLSYATQKIINSVTNIAALSDVLLYGRRLPIIKNINKRKLQICHLIENTNEGKKIIDYLYKRFDNMNIKQLIYIFNYIQKGNKINNFENIYKNAIKNMNNI